MWPNICWKFFPCNEYAIGRAKKGIFHRCFQALNYQTSVLSMLWNMLYDKWRIYSLYWWVCIKPQSRVIIWGQRWRIGNERNYVAVGILSINRPIDDQITSSFRNAVFDEIWRSLKYSSMLEINIKDPPWYRRSKILFSIHKIAVFCFPLRLFFRKRSEPFFSCF